MNDDELLVRAKIDDELSHPIEGIRENVRGLKRDVDSLGKTSTKSSRNVDSVGKSAERAAGRIKLADTRAVSFVKTLGRRGLYGAIAAVGTVLTKGFSRLDAIDQARAKLDGLGHSTRVINKIMKNALASVKGTAFGLDEAATVSAGAVAAGVKPGRDLTKELKLVADAATIAGTGMGEMGAIFNKVAASNKIQGDVIAQLNDAGIPIIQLLSKELGVSASETVKLASAGKVNFKTFRKAMESGLGGAALKSGNTFTGALKNMWASVGRIGANLLSGVFPQARDGIGGLTVELGKLEDKAKPAGQEIGHFFEDLKAGRGTAGEIRNALETLVKTGKDVLDLFTSLPGPVKKYGIELLLGVVAMRKLNAVLGFGEKGLATWAKGALNAETRAGTLKNGIRQLAGGAGLALLFSATAKATGSVEELTSQASQGNDRLRLMKGAAGGAAAGFAAFGPLGAAIGGVGGALYGVWQNGRAANAVASTGAPKIQAYADTFTRLAGAATKATENTIKYNLQQSGALESARMLGISEKTLVGVMMGRGKAMDTLKKKFAEAQAIRNNSLSPGDAAVFQLPNGGDALAALQQQMFGNKGFGGTGDHQTSGLVKDFQAQAAAAEKIAARLRASKVILNSFPKALANKFKEGSVNKTETGIARLVNRFKLDRGQTKTLLTGLDMGHTKKDIQGVLDKAKELGKSRPKVKVSADTAKARAEIEGLLALARSLSAYQATSALPGGPAGDTKTSHARGSGSLAGTLTKHNLIAGSLGGGYRVSNALIGGGGHGRGSGDHQKGRAVDVVGRNLPAYARAVREDGGYAAIHGSGRGKHVHAVMGDTATSRGGSMGSGRRGGVMIAPGAVQITVHASTELDVEMAVHDGIRSYVRAVEEASD